MLLFKSDILGQSISKQQGSETQGDFQEYTFLPETQDGIGLLDDPYDMADEVEDSGMEAGIESQSDDDNDENDDMIVLDPEHVSTLLGPSYLSMRLGQIPFHVHNI